MDRSGAQYFRFFKWDGDDAKKVIRAFARQEQINRFWVTCLWAGGFGFTAMFEPPAHGQANPDELPGEVR